MKKLLYFPLLVIFSLVITSCNDRIDDDNPWKDKITIDTRGVADLRDGITILSDDSLAFVLHAPNKQNVYILGDFNGWQKLKQYRMLQEGDRFYLRIGDLEPGKEYAFQYLIDNKIRVADPYSNKIADPNNDKYIPSTIYPDMPAYPASGAEGIVSIVSTTPKTYNWSVSDFKIEKPDNMVIYEMLLRDFTTEKSIKAAKEKIPYLKSLGVTAIELMPFNEFEGNNSWGYNPSFYFATDKAYGTDKDYKDFIDECHKNGIGVIMDMVLNHSYGECPFVKMYLEGDKVKNSPWYNEESPNSEYSWGYDFNHESISTQNLVDSICSFWMSEYKIDGFRFDFTKGFTNTKGNGWDYDASRIAILKRMNNEIKKRKSDAIVIFEHLTDNKEETELANAGIYLWGNMNEKFNQATMGWTGNDLSWTSYKQRGWNSPMAISYMESLDEERLMFKNLQHGNKGGEQDATLLVNALQRNAAATVIYMTIPGPKMIWQFGELGYDYQLNDDRLAEKPVRWDYYDEPDRKALHDVYAKMINLRNTNLTFTTTDFTMEVGEGFFKQVLLRSETSSVCAVANFDVNSTTGTIKFGKSGVWVDQFSGEELTVNNTDVSITMKPGEYRLYILK